MLPLFKLRVYIIKQVPYSINTINTGYCRKPIPNNLDINYYDRDEKYRIVLNEYLYHFYVDPYRIETPLFLPCIYYRNIFLANKKYKFTINIFNDEFVLYALNGYGMNYSLKTIRNNTFTECEMTKVNSTDIVHYYVLKNHKYCLSRTVIVSKLPYIVCIYYKKNKVKQITIHKLDDNIRYKYEPF